MAKFRPLSISPNQRYLRGFMCVRGGFQPTGRRKPSRRSSKGSRGRGTWRAPRQRSAGRRIGCRGATGYGGVRYLRCDANRAHTSRLNTSGRKKQLNNLPPHRGKNSQPQYTIRYGDTDKPKGKSKAPTHSRELNKSQARFSIRKIHAALWSFLGRSWGSLAPGRLGARHCLERFWDDLG